MKPIQSNHTDDVLSDIFNWCTTNKISDVERKKLEKLFIRAIKGSNENYHDSRSTD